jgi:hypothetical protein
MTSSTLRRVTSVAAFGLVASLIPELALATAIPVGVGNIGGTVNVCGGPGCTNPGIFFFNDSTVSEAYLEGGTNTGSFAGLTNGNGTFLGGEILNLTGNPQTGAVSITDEATFVTTLGLIQFDITDIPGGGGTNANCASNTIGGAFACTPTGSPFTLTQTGDQGNGNTCTDSSCAVAILLNMVGVGYTGSSSTGTTPTSAIFTAQVIVPGTISAVLGQVDSSGGLVGQTYSASFSAVATPEPGPLPLVLLGLGLICLGKKKFARISGR